MAWRPARRRPAPAGRLRVEAAASGGRGLAGTAGRLPAATRPGAPRCGPGSAPTSGPAVEWPGHRHPPQHVRATTRRTAAARPAELEPGGVVGHEPGGHLRSTRATNDATTAASTTASRSSAVTLPSLSHPGAPGQHPEEGAGPHPSAQRGPTSAGAEHRAVRGGQVDRRGRREVAHRGLPGAVQRRRLGHHRGRLQRRAPRPPRSATATCSAVSVSDGSATVAAAYVRPSSSRTAAPSTAPIRAAGRPGQGDQLGVLGVQQRRASAGTGRAQASATGSAVLLGAWLGAGPSSSAVGPADQHGVDPVAPAGGALGDQPQARRPRPSRPGSAPGRAPGPAARRPSPRPRRPARTSNSSPRSSTGSRAVTRTGAVVQLARPAGARRRTRR